MKLRFVFAMAALCLIFALPLAAQNLKCFILTPPDQILAGVKQIAIADFTVTTSFSEDDSPTEKGKKGLDKILSTVEKISEADKNKGRFSDSGRKLSDAMLSMLIENDRGVREVAAVAHPEERAAVVVRVVEVVERQELRERLERCVAAAEPRTDEMAPLVGQRIRGDADQEPVHHRQEARERESRDRRPALRRRKERQQHGDERDVAQDHERERRLVPGRDLALGLVRALGGGLRLARGGRGVPGLAIRMRRRHVRSSFLPAGFWPVRG